ncbi:hypothetical protein ACFL0Y_03850 [Patescibacteria group bacterium]
MAKKKRKTRQEKIIAQLKRELTLKSENASPGTMKSKPRQEPISSEPKSQVSPIASKEKVDDSILSFDPRLIKKDLLKTIILSLIALSLEFMLYLKLR